MITNLDTNFNYEDEGYDAEPIGNWVLVIPHLHPGYVSYGPGSPDILKLMYLTWAMTFLLLDVLLDLDYDHTVPLEPGTKAFAERALENLEGRDDYGPLKVELDAIRDKVNTWRREDATGKKFIFYYV